MNEKEAAAVLGCLSYGLYVVTCREGERDNGLILNTVFQVTDSPDRVAVAINKQHYSHEIIKRTGEMNVNCLATDTPLKVIEKFGFQSGRQGNKFADCALPRAANGLVYLPHHITGYLSLRAERYVDMDTHGLFLCALTGGAVTGGGEPMTYAYYLQYVKPQ